MTAHTCHATGCTKKVPPKMFMCRSHWYKLTQNMRSDIWANYIPGQEITKSPTDEYLQVARTAIKYLEELEQV